MTETTIPQYMKTKYVIPQFYLDRFRDADGMVWAYAPNAEPRPIRPEDVAKENDFYLDEDEAEPDDDFDRAIWAIQGEAAEAWDDLIEGKAFSGAARDAVARFVAFRFARAPKQIAAMQEADKEEGIDRTEQLAELENRPPSDGPRPRRDLIPGVYTLAEFFTQMNWVVLRSEGQHLITGDFPVEGERRRVPGHPAEDQGGLVHPGVNLSLPLTPERALQLSWMGNERDCIVDISRPRARQLNTVRAHKATGLLYAYRRDPGIQKLCDNSFARKGRPDSPWART